jgi:hypothetical protein
VFTVTREMPELIATLSLDVVNLPLNDKSDTPLALLPLLTRYATWFPHYINCGNINV